MKKNKTQPLASENLQMTCVEQERHEYCGRGKCLRAGPERSGISAEEEKSLPAGASHEGFPRGGRIFYGPQKTVVKFQEQTPCKQRPHWHHEQMSPLLT